MKKIIVIMTIVALTLMMVACGGNVNKKSSNEFKSEGWQKIDDMEFSLKDGVFATDGSPWRETSEGIRFINENRNNIFIKGESLSKDHTWKKFVEERKKAIAGSIAKKVEYKEVKIGDIDALQYSYYFEASLEAPSEYTCGLLFANKDSAYEISTSDKSLETCKKVLENLKNTISFKDKKIGPNIHKFRGMCFELDKKIWHDTTDRRFYGRKSNGMIIAKIAHNDFNQEHSDEELFEIVHGRFDKLAEAKKLTDLKYEKVEIDGKQAMEFSYKEGKTIYAGFHIPYQNMEYIIQINSNDNELIKKQLEAIKKTIKFEEAGLKVPLRM